MENPCNKCKVRKQCIEYDELVLAPVMLSKGDPPDTIQGSCKMGGCPLDAKAKGYCMACYQLVRSRQKKKQPAPKKLTSKQIKQREARR